MQNFIAQTIMQERGCPIRIAELVAQDLQNIQAPLQDALMLWIEKETISPDKFVGDITIQKVMEKQRTDIYGALLSLS